MTAGLLAVALAAAAMLAGATVAFGGVNGAAALWLAAATAWTAVPLGCLGLALAAQVLPRPLATLAPAVRSGLATLPVAALLFLPVPFALLALHGAMARGASAWWAPEFLLIRMALYWAAWLGLAWALRRGRTVGAGGLILYVLSVALAGVDWIMGLDPIFNSSLLGLIHVWHQVATAVAFVILVAVVKAPAARLPPHWGGLLLGTALIWAYLAFTHYLVIWISDHPDLIRWPLQRGVAPWPLVATVLAATLGAAPAALMTSSRLRRSRAAVGVAAGSLLAFHALHASWLTLPATGAGPAILAAATAAGLLVVGVFMAAAMRASPPVRAA